MPASYSQMYLHLVWATSLRQPTLEDEVKQLVYRCIQAECRALNVPVLALGGLSDQVHLLVRFPATITVAKLVQQVKGSSSHLVSNSTENKAFAWQVGYGAFTVTKSLVPQVERYIATQEERHQNAKIIPALERISWKAE